VAFVSAGFKWLCGPYGTGVCWLRPELFDTLRPTKLYWLSALTSEDLAAASLDLEAITPRRTGRFDVFGTANFFNFVPFTAALELLVERGIDDIAAPTRSTAPSTCCEQPAVRHHTWFCDRDVVPTHHPPPDPTLPPFRRRLRRHCDPGLRSQNVWRW
jgi:hypothetical protein